MTAARRERPAWRRLTALVAAVLVAGLIIGIAADITFGTRPVATLVFGVLAAQLAMLAVYRNIVASLRGISDDSAEGEETEQS
ncbi:MAG TPA: AtpZ/AtpI family protein [Chloroflexota bacterium]